MMASSVLQTLRRRPLWLRPRPLVADAALAAVIAAVSVLLTLTVSAGDPGMPDAVRYPDSPLNWAILVWPSAAVAFRRRFPSGALLVGAVGQAVVWANAHPDGYLAMGVLLYSAATHGGQRGRRSAITCSVLLTLYTASGWLYGEAPLYAVAIVCLFSTATVAAGLGTAGRDAYAEAMAARALAAERSSNADRARALSEERNRIARELHDVVAHGLSVIVLQAAAAERILDRDPEGARAAIGQIERTGRTSLNEMRQVLVALRTDPTEQWRPAPGLASLDELVDELGRAGVEVTLIQHGEPAETMPATVGLTAFRLVQESLTNVVKHGGPGASATVEIEHRPDAIAISVVDDGQGAAAAEHNGHGLQGMQERVEIFGGRFEAGPRPAGGYGVTVTLPLDRSAETATVRPETRAVHP